MGETGMVDGHQRTSPEARERPRRGDGRESDPGPRAFARSLSGVAKHEHGDFLFSEQMIELFGRHRIEVPIRYPSDIDRTARVVHQGIADGELRALPIIRHCHPAKICNPALFLLRSPSALSRRQRRSPSRLYRRIYMFRGPSVSCGVRFPRTGRRGRNHARSPHPPEPSEQPQSLEPVPFPFWLEARLSF